MRKEPILKIVMFTQPLLFDFLITDRFDFKVYFKVYDLSELYRGIGFNLVTF
jgi:hypothetical protein